MTSTNPPAPPIDGAALLDEVEAFHRRFNVFPTEHAYVAVALWDAHAHLIDAFDGTARLAFLSPEPGSGKSRALEITETLTPRAATTVNASANALFRLVEADGGTPTLLFDEIDTVFGPKAGGNANGAARHVGAKLVDVARRAEVSAATVSNVLNRPDMVAERTRIKVETAIADLGYVRSGQTGETAAHWRRTGFATWLFHPATTGWYPKKAPQEAHPVPVMAHPWPGVPARGRNASGRADACSLPIARGLTPHGLRHSHKTVMEELGTPPKLMDERMGHEDGSVQARYSHITARMRNRLMGELTEQWEEALAARSAMHPRSPVRALDALLRERHG